MTIPIFTTTGCRRAGYTWKTTFTFGPVIDLSLMASSMKNSCYQLLCRVAVMRANKSLSSHPYLRLVRRQKPVWPSSRVLLILVLMTALVLVPTLVPTLVLGPMLLMPMLLVPVQIMLMLALLGPTLLLPLLLVLIPMLVPTLVLVQMLLPPMLLVLVQMLVMMVPLFMRDQV